MFFRLPPARRGLSLTEVLIAMFVMAIGMISLLVLFPVGIINTKWALQDNRVAVAANNANSLGEAARYDTTNANNYSLRVDPVYRTALQSPAARVQQVPGGTLQPFFDAAAGGGIGQWRFGTTGPGAPVSGPYPPIFVDPVGATQWSAVFNPGTGAWFVPTSHLGYSIGVNAQFRNVPLRAPADNINQSLMRRTQNFNIPIVTNLGVVTIQRQSLGLPRVYTSNLPDLPALAQDAARRLCVMTDDIAFTEQGNGTRETSLAPADPVPQERIPNVRRELRYSWAYMCRWPQATDASVVDMSVVVYAARPLSRAGVGGAAVFPPGEQANYLGLPPGPANIVNNVSFNSRVFIQGSREAVIRLPPANPTSTIRRGDWILDNTLIMPSGAVDPSTGFTEYAPFAQRIVRLPRPGFTPAFIDTGIANGHFYSVTKVSEVLRTGAGIPYQIVELNVPAKADGYEAVHMQGVADVIEKSSGKTPTR